MDLILPPFAAAHLESMDEADLTLYEALLNENDHDLYQWVTGQVAAPDAYVGMIGDIQALLKAQRVYRNILFYSSVSVRAVRIGEWK